ncbi:hypothetical protein [Streptomyces sp. NBC_00568]|uniref:hypothetical protein n=1 Tax=Streptomyces sp. NBC_00568 TaxID=2975779 RepID=UPI002256C118|nr:hypothetical protein [Streptomyces sp. NBC_00568]MCX4993506.1 hypothetical protein [Streptomyces sp. NBC_00568]
MLTISAPVILAVVVVGVLVAAFSRGRWDSPSWLTIFSVVVSHLVIRQLMEKAFKGTATWLLIAFEVSCGILIATLLSPVYHHLRGRGGATQDSVSV